MLTEIQIKVAELVFQGTPISRACDEAGTARCQYYKWIKEDREFIEFIEKMKVEAVGEAITLVKAAAVKAANKLISHIDNKVSKISLDACKEVLNISGLNPALKNNKLEEETKTDYASADDIQRVLAERRKKEQELRVI